MEKTCSDYRDWMPRDPARGGGGRRYTRVVVSVPPDRIAELPGGEVPPEWLRTTFVDEDGPYRDIDKVYIPIGPLGEATEQLLCACYDGVPILNDDGCAYVPVSWSMREHPEGADQLKVLVERAIKTTREGVG